MPTAMLVLPTLELVPATTSVGTEGEPIVLLRRPMQPLRLLSPNYHCCMQTVNSHQCLRCRAAPLGSLRSTACTQPFVAG